MAKNKRTEAEEFANEFGIYTPAVQQEQQTKGLTKFFSKKEQRKDDKKEERKEDKSE